MDDEDYEEKPVSEVGYRKPPKAHQFKKGQSGNLNGRPRKAKKVQTPPGMTPLTADVILSEGRRLVNVRDGDKVEAVDAIQAMVRSLLHLGLKGNRRALTDAIRLMREAEAENEKLWASLINDVADYKTEWREHFADCDARGIPRPEFAPHPDEVVLDHVNRCIIYNGPANMAEKAAWDRKRADRDDYEAENKEMIQIAREEGRDIKVLLHVIELNKAIIRVIDGIYPDPTTRRAAGFNLHEWRRRNGVLAQLKRDGLYSFVPEKYRGLFPNTIRQPDPGPAEARSLRSTA
jgi:hypothetical protein